MTDQIISAHSVKMRWPMFESVPSTQIEFAIEEAALKSTGRGASTRRAA